MNDKNPLLLSVIVPAFNEQLGIEEFHAGLSQLLNKNYLHKYEIIYCDDGSTDNTQSKILQIAKSDNSVKLIRLSRNFGKEIAITAGIQQARGQAILSIDADGQHPIELIPQFVDKWQAGAKIVVGKRLTNQEVGFFKNYFSSVFYKIINSLSGAKLEPGTTDFRLIDKTVQAEFIKLTERNRINRGLIDWLGYKPAYITFNAKSRLAGNPSYSFSKLIVLAIDSFISLSIKPLYISFFMGLFILPCSILLGTFMLGDALLGDPLLLNAKGTAYLAVLLIFLAGVILISQGVVGLYVSHIHAETQNRPLFIVDKENSFGISEE